MTGAESICMRSVGVRCACERCLRRMRGSRVLLLVLSAAAWFGLYECGHVGGLW